MKKGLFTAAVIAAMMMTQPVMAQEVVEQTGEIVQQTEEDVSESDMAADYQMETDLAAEINVFSADNNETPIVSADPTGQEGDKDAEEGDKEPEIKTGWQTEEGKTYSEILQHYYTGAQIRTSTTRSGGLFGWLAGLFR